MLVILKINYLVYKKKLLKMFYKIPSISRLAEDTQTKLNNYHWHSTFILQKLKIFKIIFVSTSSIISIKQWTDSVHASSRFLYDVFEDLRIKIQKIPGTPDCASLTHGIDFKNK